MCRVWYKIFYEFNKPLLWYVVRPGSQQVDRPLKQVTDSSMAGLHHASWSRRVHGFNKCGCWFIKKIKHKRGSGVLLLDNLGPSHAIEILRGSNEVDEPSNLLLYYIVCVTTHPPALQSKICRVSWTKPLPPRKDCFRRLESPKLLRRYT